MSEEMQTIQPKYGPYVGGHISVTKSMAEQAIKDGWAVDPYAQPTEEEPYDEAKVQAATEAANAAAAVLRGEAPAEGASGKANHSAASADQAEETKRKTTTAKPEDPFKTTRSLEAESKPSGGYDTRSTKK